MGVGSGGGVGRNRCREQGAGRILGSLDLNWCVKGIMSEFSLGVSRVVYEGYILFDHPDGSPSFTAPALGLGS